MSEWICTKREVNVEILKDAAFSTYITEKASCTGIQ